MDELQAKTKDDKLKFGIGDTQMLLMTTKFLNTITADENKVINLFTATKKKVVKYASN